MSLGSYMLNEGLRTWPVSRESQQEIPSGVDRPKHGQQECARHARDRIIQPEQKRPDQHCLRVTEFPSRSCTGRQTCRRLMSVCTISSLSLVGQLTAELHPRRDCQSVGHSLRSRQDNQDQNSSPRWDYASHMTLCQ